jgi:hypothetical protein
LKKKYITKKLTQKKLEKNHVRKSCSNPQCFVRKVTVFSPHDLALLVFTYNCNSQPAQYLKKKLTKTILEKKQKKTMWEKYCSNP